MSHIIRWMWLVFPTTKLVVLLENNVEDKEFWIFGWIFILDLGQRIACFGSVFTSRSCEPQNHSLPNNCSYVIYPHPNFLSFFDLLVAFPERALYIILLSLHLIFPSFESLVNHLSHFVQWSNMQEWIYNKSVLFIQFVMSWLNSNNLPTFARSVHHVACFKYFNNIKNKIIFCSV